MFPVPRGTSICQAENSDSWNQSEMAFKSALYQKKKALSNSCLLPGNSFSLPLRFFSTPAKASYLTSMLEFCRERTKKKRKKKELNNEFHPPISALCMQLGTTCLERLWKSTRQLTSDDWDERRDVAMNFPFFSLCFLEHLQWGAGLIHR